MRLMADENVPGDLIAELRARGHDVLWARVDCPGTDDPGILARAQSESRLLLTFDKDFGELAFRSGMPASSGVILLRLAAPLKPDAIARFADVLEARIDWSGHLSSRTASA